jgi:hypothetical protein
MDTEEMGYEDMRIQQAQDLGLISSGSSELVMNLQVALTLCRSYLNPYCMGRKTGFFSAGI